MIKSWKHKGLHQLFKSGRSARVNPDLQGRCLRLLDQLDAAKSLRSLSHPGTRVHPLRGSESRYSLSVNGPWRITFDWIDGDAFHVDLEQYH